MIELILRRKMCNGDTFVRIRLPLCTFPSELISVLHAGSQLSLAKKYHLPLFLHSRAAHKDFVQILREEGYDRDGGRAVGGKGGVVHSFTGTPEEATELVSRDLEA